MEAKGKLLKTVGILLVICGILAIILSLISLFGDGLVLKSAGDSKVVEHIGIIALIYSIVSLISGVVDLLAGICGIRHCNHVSASSLCMRYGKIMLVFALIGIVMGFLSETYDMAHPVYVIAALIGSFILPILYMVGASANRHSEKKMLADKAKAEKAEKAAQAKK